jgi:hypothetical protein
MRRRSTTLLFTISLGLTAMTAAAGDGRKDRPVPFLGVFHPVFAGGGIAPDRCPDPSHPLLLTFTGEAYTTLGRAKFEQSHCEAADHSSFRRGLQTITFENGEMLFGTYRGDLLPTPTTVTDGRLIIDGTYHNQGGTGSLKDARGSGISAGVVNTSTGGAEVTVSGTL